MSNDDALFPAEASDPYCISAEDADSLLAGARWRRFAVMGDSLATDVGLREALQRQLPSIEYLNTGHVGARAAGGARRPVGSRARLPARSSRRGVRRQ